MGVSGCGKTTVARAAARQTGVRFLDADDLHSADAVAQMHRGVPLTAEQRDAWMDRVVEATKGPSSTILACSALRRAHRERLRTHAEAYFFLLDVPVAELRRRLAQRSGHFFDPSLLDDQLATLEMPEAGERITVLDGCRPVTDLAADIERTIGRPDPR